ncbi:MAG TPA: hypothetical protein PKA33_00805 [Amaricoccus sp.]|uniref:hypothetical protein n=1 Tax=Amaricoccus sp. TaxID=1872485 RepID=UPI002B5327C3|nr:hypothetical protein [Amaricoccus sp.]HMQ91518.1 hypothetical protein [Amaricoccus sp.]HMR50937.1 hypothetical protein [Amaricoccus sp.]HMR58892.1 hypothetical protein [Amaricoccus sp.]HMT97884.1 hypothetical protein [Amaricoccus sp.]
MAHDYSFELGGASVFDRSELISEGFSIAWRGELREMRDGSGWTRPVVYVRNGSRFPGYVSGRSWIVFDRCPASGLESAKVESTRACDECC